MRRPLRRNTRMQGARRSGAFDPLADPDLAGLWLASGASDDGATLTVPNSLAGGVDATATGAGRATVDPAALEGAAPGIVTTGMTVPLTAAIDITGAAGMTVYVVAYTQGTAIGYLWRYGTGNQSAFAAFNNPGAGNMDVRKASGVGTETLHADAQAEGLFYARVLAFRFDIDADADEVLLPMMDGDVTFDRGTGGNPDLDTTGSFDAGPLYIGSTTGAAAPFPGAIGAAAVVARKHTDAEVAQWTAWLRREVAMSSQARQVAWMGDSITACSAAGAAAWRKRIQDNFDAVTDRRYRTIGGTLDQADTAFTHDRGFAQGGNTISDVQAYIAAFHIGTVYQPDLIPILIGTNDVAAGTSNTDIATAYGALLDALSASCPGALLVAQKLLPRTDNVEFGAQVDDWNASYHDAMVAAAVSRGVNVISDDTLSTLPGITYLDGLHPDAASTNIMGDAMEAKVREWMGWT